MKQKSFKRILICLVMMALLAAAALSISGCVKPQSAPPTVETAENSTLLGEGETSFFLEVTDVEGKTISYQVHTDEATVGDALLKLGFINGDAGEFGLYVKTVNGITLNYDTDGKYWAFYTDGEYASAGVDQTAITDGSTYAFKAE